MSKGPTPRHSKSPKPVTIDLDATDVTPKNGPGATARSTADKSTADKPSTDKPSTDPGAAKAVETGSSPKPAGKPAAAQVEPAATEKSGAAKPSTGKSGAETGPTGSQSGKTGTSAGGASAETTGAGSGAGTARISGAEKDADKPESAKAPASVDGVKSPDRETRSAAPASAQPAPGRRGGGLSMVASGVIGAIIALGGGYALQSSGLLPAPGAGTGDSEQSQALATRVDGLAADLENLSVELAARPTGEAIGGELMARLESLEAAVTASDGQGDGSAAATDIADLANRINEIEGRLAALGESDGGAAADPALAAAMAEIRAGQTGMNSAMGELQSQTAALFDQMSGLEQEQLELSGRIDQRLDTLEARLDEPAQQVDLARAIAAAGLKTAIDRGGSFMSELEAFASVAPDDPAVPELRDLAARGVPSRSDLIERFPEAANRAIAAAEPVDPDASLVDRLMSSAMSVVKVRQVGEVEGDTAEAIAARAETRLLDGDLDAALAEWSALPEDAQTAAADYGDALAARARAEKLIAASLAPGASPADAESVSDAPAN